MDNKIEYKCLRCGHKWIPRIFEIPKTCPRCKSYVWNIPPKESKR